jgi:hypothetical protein
MVSQITDLMKKILAANAIIVVVVVFLSTVSAVFY